MHGSREGRCFCRASGSCMRERKIVGTIKVNATKAPVILYASSSASGNIECQMGTLGRRIPQDRATSSSCSRTQRIVRYRLTSWHVTFRILFLRTLRSHSRNYHKKEVRTLEARTLSFPMNRHIYQLKNKICRED